MIPDWVAFPIMLVLVWAVVALVAVALISKAGARQSELDAAYRRGKRDALLASNANLERVLYDTTNPKIIHFDGVTKKEVSR